MRLPDDLDPDGPDLTIAELSDRLGLSERTIRRHLEQGKLPGAYLLGKYRIPQRSVINYLSLRTIPPESTTSPE